MTTAPPVDGAADRASAAILDGIRAGRFVPGQHLPESELGRVTGVSRGPLREALRHLASVGVVSLNRYCGASIERLDAGGMGELLDVLEPLAGLAVRLAAAQCRLQHDRDRIAAAIAAIDRATRDPDRSVLPGARHDFYDVLLQIGGNRELRRIIPLARIALYRSHEPIGRAFPTAAYGWIGEAVMANRPAAAELAIRSHFEAKRAWLAALRPREPAIGGGRRAARSDREAVAAVRGMGLAGDPRRCVGA